MRSDEQRQRRALGQIKREAGRKESELNDRDDEIKELLDGVGLTSPWTDRISRACPCCGAQLDISPGLSNPNAAKAYCGSCGFTALMTAPRNDWDGRWADGESVEV